MIYSVRTANFITKACLRLARPAGRPAVRHASLPGRGGAGRAGVGSRPHGTAAPALADPYSVVRPHLASLNDDIWQSLSAPGRPELAATAGYYFDGEGKMVRPLVAALVAMAVNAHLGSSARLLASQLHVAQAAEMIHTASLLHDDVLDGAGTRRGKPSVLRRYRARKSVQAGNFIQARATTLLARLHCPEVLVILAKVTRELVTGEFMQLSAAGDPEERFRRYLDKSFKKTASLIAHSCEAVALLGGADESLQQLCFDYGRSLGIAFQLVDDLLDFVALSEEIGKPIAVDLSLGMATAPVLYAAEQFPELEELIQRRFSEAGDVRFATECVRRSEGLQRTRELARRHCQDAARLAAELRPSRPRDALCDLTELVLTRKR